MFIARSLGCLQKLWICFTCFLKLCNCLWWLDLHTKHAAFSCFSLFFLTCWNNVAVYCYCFRCRVILLNLPRHSWLPISYQRICWEILLRNPVIFNHCTVLITAFALFQDPFSGCQVLNQYQGIIQKEQTQHEFTSLCPGRSCQSFFFQLKLWNEICEVALISKAVASLFHQRKSAGEKKNVWTSYFRLRAWKPGILKIGKGCIQSYSHIRVTEVCSVPWKGGDELDREYKDL